MKAIRLVVLFATLMMTAGAVVAGESRVRVNMNPAWRFSLGEPAGEPFATGFNDEEWEIVSLPHTHDIFPTDLKGYRENGRNVGWYRRAIDVPAEWSGKRVFMEFQGAMQTTKLWVNGAPAGEYAVSGYDSFHFDITDQLKPGKNILAVRVDNTVNSNIPPDGKPTDFELFGGLYRDVHLVVTDPLHITFPWEAKEAGIRLTLPEVSATQAVVKVDATVRNDSKSEESCAVLTEIRNREGNVVVSMSDTCAVPAGASQTFSQSSQPIDKPNLWSPKDPYLYQVHTIVRRNGKEVDRVVTRLGIRWVKWDKVKGFFLNGEHLKLVGANRHQSWPFIGNAVPNGLHRRDAEQMKSIGCNWVRCSHYPHDPDFLDALDELGIMALEEGPTWGEIGGQPWMDNLEHSFRSMIRRDRNHPSIIIWNCCVNHGGGNTRLIAAATEEDPTRARGQDTVRCPMDFSHKSVSGGGALTIEHTGHTFPAHRGERYKKDVSGNVEYDQAKRHYEQTDAAFKNGSNSGLAVWSLYDYNSLYFCPDGIRPHGALDLFRIPKYSYWWHISELTATPMSYIVRIDESNVCVFSNCEEVRLTTERGVKTQNPDPGFALHHPPFHFKVAPETAVIKAEGLIGGVVRAACEWKKPGVPVRLVLDADRSTITADGADISRIIVSAVDANGTAVDDCKDDVTFALEGAGRLIGENPAQLRAGKMIVLAQSGFARGKLKIRATAGSLMPASVIVKTTRCGADVDMPVTVPSTRKDLIVNTDSSAAGSTGAPVKTVLKFEPRKDVSPGVWVESNPIFLNEECSLAIEGGEYRVYTSPWSSKPGKAIANDAVYVRVKSADKPGGQATVILRAGKASIRFEVTTKK